MSEPWFDPELFGAMVGAIGGGVGGTLGGLLGAAAGTLAPQGKARGLILGSMWLFVVLGVACLAVGVYAIIDGQPYGIFFPLLLVGTILAAVIGGLIPVVRLRYQQAEQRLMQARDIREGGY